VEYRSPDNSQIPSPTLVNRLLANRETEPGPVDREWHYVMWKPAVPNDLTYIAAGTEADVGYCLLFLVQGAPVGAQFEFDFIAHFELIGDAVPVVTPSHTDPLGMAVAQVALSSHQPDLSPEDNFKQVARSISSIAANTLSFVGTAMDTVETVSNVAGAIASLL